MFNIKLNGHAWTYTDNTILFFNKLYRCILPLDFILFSCCFHTLQLDFWIMDEVHLLMLNIRHDVVKTMLSCFAHWSLVYFWRFLTAFSPVLGPAGRLFVPHRPSKGAPNQLYQTRRFDIADFGCYLDLSWNIRI